MADASGSVDGRLEESATPDAAQPSGGDVLTLLNGVVDAPRVAFCFLRLEGTVPVPIGVPVPAGGLAYGHAHVLSGISGAKPAVDTLQIAVVSGDLTAILGRDCAAVLAGSAQSPPAARFAEGGPDAPSEASPDDAGLADVAATDGTSSDAGSGDAPMDAGSGLADASDDAGGTATTLSFLPALPAGTFSGQRSLLLVAAGCVGGPGHTSPSELSVCGDGYTSKSPTIRPVLVTLSRTTGTGRVGLQGVNASAATPWVELRNTPKDGAGAATIATKVVFGAIAPVPPRLDKPLVGYAIDDSAIEVFVQGSTVASQSHDWLDVLGRSGGLTLLNGRSYSLVLLGPRPGFTAFEWWQAPLLVALDNDPSVVQ